MNGNVIKALTGVGLVVLAVLGIVDYGERRETNKKIGMSMKELKESSNLQIQQSMVERAVKEAANDRITDCISRVKGEVVSDARIKLADETRKAVLEAKDVIKKEVNERISTEASLIDMSELKKSARDAAEEKILAKFDSNLDDLLDKANKNLSNYMEIYEGIASAIHKGNRDSDKGFKVSFG